MATMTDLSNGGNGRTRTGNGRFRPGNAGGPGRPKGSPNRGTVDARQIRSELLASCRKHGPAALETVAREKPLDYLRLVVSRLPSDVEPVAPRSKDLPPPAGRADEVVPGPLDEAKPRSRAIRCPSVRRIDARLQFANGCRFAS